MKEANEEQLRQKHERQMAEKEEHNRLVQIMNDKHRVRPLNPLEIFRRSGCFFVLTSVRRLF